MYQNNPLTYYLQLQYRMLNRHMVEFGVHPIIGYIGGLFTFIILSLFFFYKVEFPEYLYTCFGTLTLIKNSENDRNQFLKSCFPSAEYIKIRLIENLLYILPFTLFLLFKQYYIFGLIGILLAGTLSFNTFGSVLQGSLPTPFSKRPFESIIGFRKTFLVILLIYFVCIMALSVANFNLGLFTLVLIYLNFFFYYEPPEGEYHVWIYALTAQQFLKEKIKTASLHTTFLAAPIIISLACVFSQHLLIIFGIIIIGNVYLATAILAKYASFPLSMHLPQAILFGMAIFFPPLLLGIIPFLYKKSIHRLNTILT